MIVPLLRLELRRQRAVLLRMIGLTIAIAAVFYLAGKRDPSHLFATLVGSSLGVVLIVPMGISRDKLEGTLDFICGLPVEAREIAASRLIAMAVLALPWAISIGAFSFTIFARGGPNPVAVALLGWLGMLVIGATATAAFARYELEQLLGIPAAFVALMALFAPRVVHALVPGMTPERLLYLMQQPAAPLVITLVLVALLLTLGGAAFALAIRGFELYRHDLARR